MSKSTFTTLVLVALLLLPASPRADAKKHEWFGEWAMSHDGNPATLRIAELKADCNTTPWCDMSISYVNQKGVRHAGRIERIDGKGQHMLFTINFPGNAQKFDAYIFSWDKRKLAGTTVWSGRTFGFYATKH